MDELQNRRSKLRFRAQRRGFRELDLLVGAFAEERLEAMTGPELDQFEALLDQPDQDVYSWITGQASPPPEAVSPVLEALIAFRLPGSYRI